MKRILLPVLVIGILLMSACGAPTTVPVTGGLPQEPTAEEPATEEPTAKEPVTKPKPAPAKFVVTNLQAIPAPISYSVTIDVENTGDLKGVYQLRCQVAGQEMEPVEVELNTGEKKNVVLTEAQTLLDSMAAKYKSGEINQKECIVSIDGLSETVIFVAPAPPAPAEFVVTNLQAKPDSDADEVSCSVSVDVENTGDLKGVYQLRCTVTGKEMEPVEVELDAGEKKTVALSEAQRQLSSLAVKYKYGDINRGVHRISVGDLATLVTFPYPDYKLELLSTSGVLVDESHCMVSGRVKNISEESLKHVEAVVETYTGEGKLIGSTSTRLYHDPLLPDQVSGFSTSAYFVDAKYYIVYLKFLNGDTIPTRH